MNNRLKDESLDSLFEAILTLQNKEECFSFSVIFVLRRSLKLCPNASM